MRSKSPSPFGFQTFYGYCLVVVVVVEESLEGGKVVFVAATLFFFLKKKANNLHYTQWLPFLDVDNSRQKRLFELLIGCEYVLAECKYHAATKAARLFFGSSSIFSKLSPHTARRRRTTDDDDY